MFGIPSVDQKKKEAHSRFSIPLFRDSSHLSAMEKLWSIITFSLGTFSLLLVICLANTSHETIQRFISPLGKSFTVLSHFFDVKKEYKRFSFVPGWSSSKFDLIDFDNLSTLAYFDIPFNADGSLNQDNQGYETLQTEKFSTLLQTAHDHNVSVLLTLTQTENNSIREFLVNKEAQDQLASQTLEQLKASGADGVTVDIEYTGNAGAYRDLFSTFVRTFAQAIHNKNSQAQVTVAISTSAANQSLYDIQFLAKHTDSLFVMAYDFATPEIKNGTVIAPVYGYDGKEYLGTVNNVINTFFDTMPREKFVLERAWYGNGDQYPFYQSTTQHSTTSNQQEVSYNTLTTPLSRVTIERLVSEVPANARGAARRNLPFIAKALEDEGILNSNVLAYALATIEHETAGTFEPIDEFKGRKSARRLGYEGGINYFGRGFIQLTHLRNYLSMGKRIGMGDALAKSPELMSDPTIAAKVLAAFFKENGVATLATNGRFIAARRPINPDYEGSWIASLAWKYLDMLG